MPVNKATKASSSTQTTDNFLMSPTVDFCFKELLSYPHVRKGFVAALLHCDPDSIQSTELIPTILSKETADSKYGILNVRIRMANGTQIDLEMQVVPFAFWEKRILFYLSKMYTDQVKEGDGYQGLKKCMHVSILNFTHFPDDTECHHEIAFCDMHTHKKYTDLFEIHILELKKLPPKEPDEPLLITWLRFFAATRKDDFEKMADKDTYISDAYDILKKLSADERKRLEYEARQKALLDHNSQVIGYFEAGVEQGKALGEEQGRMQGELRYNSLIKLLLDAGRMDDLKKVLSDENYRKKLFEEFQL